MYKKLMERIHVEEYSLSAGNCAKELVMFFLSRLDKR
jgi:hypothetical protein